MIADAVKKAIVNVGGIRSNNGGVDNGNTSSQGTILTIAPVGTTVTPELLAVLMNNTGFSNGGQQALAGMIYYNCRQMGHRANTCGNPANPILVREAQA